MTIAGSLQDPLIGQTLGHCRITELIGVGGMGKVYRATDAHLDREVAIKVLPFGILADEKSRHRFRKEALTLSKLNHPNIATIYDFDSQGALDFLAMEYISGVTLNDKLDHGSLPEKQVIALGLQLAEGLSAAHDHGIIHRDLKPGNLRLNAEGRLKILDFGLAKLRQSASIATVTDTLSEASDMAGTLPYMAPEQIVGGELDARTDIHAAGAVLYEMATGERAFPRADRSQITAAILRTNPRPADTVNQRLSPELSRIIAKCLEKEPENRYQSAKELSIDLHRLERLTDGISSGRELTSTSRTSLFSHPTSRVILLIVATILFASCVALIVRHYRNQARIEQAGPASIAVLPFVDLSPNHDQEYFSDGLAEEILNTLAKIPGLKVVGRTSSFQFKGKNEDLRVIGRKLDVANVLEGSVRKEGNHIRITAQLIKADDGFHLWSDTYDRNVSDIFTLQDSIAEAVCAALQLHLNKPATTQVARPEAFQSFLQARYFSRLFDHDSSRKALEYATRAIELDPSYAPAYALRAEILLFQGGMAWINFSDAVATTQHDAEKTISLAPTLPAGYRVVSRIQAEYDSNCPLAMETWQKARDLAPSDPDTLALGGFIAMCLGRLEEAVTLTQQSLSNDPLRPNELINLAQFQRDLGRLGEARDSLHRVLDISPHDVIMAHEVLGEVYLRQGDPQQALLEMNQEPLTYARYLGLALAYHALGQTKESDDALAALIAQFPDSAPYQIAQVYAYRGDPNNAFLWLDRSYEHHDPGLMWFITDLKMKTLRSDPRYTGFLRCLHLA